MSRDPYMRLEDIIDACDRLQTYIADLDFKEFDEDFKTQDAVIRVFEIIGEAVHLPKVQACNGKPLNRGLTTAPTAAIRRENGTSGAACPYRLVTSKIQNQQSTIINQSSAPWRRLGGSIFSHAAGDKWARRGRHALPIHRAAQPQPSAKRNRNTSSSAFP